MPITRLIRCLIALPTALVSLPAWAQAQSDRSSFWHSGWDWGWGHMIFGSFMMILFWGGLILVIVLAVRWIGGGYSHGPQPPAGHKTPLELLQERFARGEIDKEEFEERKRLLSD